MQYTGIWLTIPEFVCKNWEKLQNTWVQAPLFESDTFLTRNKSEVQTRIPYQVISTPRTPQVSTDIFTFNSNWQS